MKTISKKDFLIGVLAAAIVSILVNVNASDAENGSTGRYAVAVGGGGGNNYSVCVTDTWTGETRCQQGGGPKEHTFSPAF